MGLVLRVLPTPIGSGVDVQSSQTHESSLQSVTVYLKITITGKHIQMYKEIYKVTGAKFKMLTP